MFCGCLLLGIGLALFNSQKYDDPDFWKNFVGGKQGNRDGSFADNLKAESNKSGSTEAESSTSSAEQRQQSLQSTLERIMRSKDSYEKGVFENRETQREQIGLGEKKALEFAEGLKQVGLQRDLNQQLELIRAQWLSVTSLNKADEKEKIKPEQEKENSIAGPGAWALKITNERSIPQQGHTL